MIDSEEMKVLAIIPARGGSKGIPRQNLRLLAGKPLIAHAIERARQTKSISRIVVSTDDPEIAAVSRQYGAEVVWRPAEISGDGWGLAQLKRLGVPILVLSTEENPVVQARCDKLGIACMRGIQDKLTVLRAWLRANKIDISQVIYVGNDVNDLACLREAGCGIAVGNAHPRARAAAKIVLSAPGGQGAIREIAELIQEKLDVENNSKND